MNDEPPENSKPENLHFIGKVRQLKPGNDNLVEAQSQSEANLPPEGMIDVTRTFLEMTRPSGRTPRAPRIDQLSLMRARNPTISFYRYLYNTVGGPWFWYERRQMSDKNLAKIIHDPKIAVYVLYVSGVPAGYVELNYRDEPEIEIAYFGLMPDFIGQGLGPYLLDWAIEKAWSSKPTRLKLHTCTLDHPKAITVYQRAGFRPYDQEVERIAHPGSSGLFKNE